MEIHLLSVDKAIIKLWNLFLIEVHLLSVDKVIIKCEMKYYLPNKYKRWTNFANKKEELINMTDQLFPFYTLYVFTILGWRYTFRSLKDSAEI